MLLVRLTLDSPFRDGRPDKVTGVLSTFVGLARRAISPLHQVGGYTASISQRFVWGELASLIRRKSQRHADNCCSLVFLDV